MNDEKVLFHFQETVLDLFAKKLWGTKIYSQLGIWQSQNFKTKQLTAISPSHIQSLDHDRCEKLFSC